MKDEYLGTIKGDDLCDYPQYRLSGKVFTRKIPACKHLNEKGFTIPEGLLYLKKLEEEAVKHALELIRGKEGDNTELQVDSVVTVYTDSSRGTDYKEAKL
jgi:hypothetical protein